MDNTNLIEKEWKMVKEYQEKQNENIALYFYEKYSNDICNIVFNKINCKFSSIPLERNDLLSFVWKGIKKTLDTVKAESKNRLLGCFITQSYFSSLREAVKFLTNGHIILNNAISIEKLDEKRQYIKAKNGTVYQEVKLHDLREEIIKQITKRLEGYNQKIIQRIIYLKSLGYSLKEISNKLQISERTIKNLFQVIVRVGRMINKN